MKKVTRATIKSFIRKNLNNLYVRNDSRFDGMVDCVMPVRGDFTEAEVTDRMSDNTLGINGLWLVGSSRDYFKPFNNGEFEGYEIHNSCGSSIIAIKS
jgi:hypothetical protein